MQRLVRYRTGARKRWQAIPKAAGLIRFLAANSEEDLRQLWSQPNKATAEKVIADWIARVEASEIRPLQIMARTIATHRFGILAYYDHPISSGPIEVTYNKIKTLKRQAYGYRDTELFKLRIMGIHESKYALTG